MPLNNPIDESRNDDYLLIILDYYFEKDLLFFAYCYLEKDLLLVVVVLGYGFLANKETTEPRKDY